MKVTRVRVSLDGTTERDSESLTCFSPVTCRFSLRAYCYEEGSSRGATRFRAKLPTNPVNRQRREDILRAFCVFPISTKDLRQASLSAKDLRFESEHKGSDRDLTGLDRTPYFRVRT